MNAALRLARPVLIGCGGAVVVWGSVYALQQQSAVTAATQPVHLSSEWALDTKAHITRAAQAFTPDQRIAAYKRALDTLVSTRLDLRTKSADWLTGYADLLRALGIAYYEDGESSQAKEALEASLSIPLGSDELQAQAAIALFWLNGGDDPQHLLQAVKAASLREMRPVADLETEQRVRAYAPLYLEAAKLLVAGKDYEAALSIFVALHKAITVSPGEDPLCYRPAAGGYVSQVLWKLNKRQDSLTWLRRSAVDATQCRTPACRDTRETLETLIEKARRGISD